MNVWGLECGHKFQREYMNSHGRMCLALTEKNVPCRLARRLNSLYCHHHQAYVHRDIYVIDKVLRWEQRDDGWYGYVRWKGFVLGCAWEKFEQEANGKWIVCVSGEQVRPRRLSYPVCRLCCGVNVKTNAEKKMKKQNRSPYTQMLQDRINLRDKKNGE